MGWWRRLLPRGRRAARRAAPPPPPLAPRAVRRRRGGRGGRHPGGGHRGPHVLAALRASRRRDSRVHLPRLLAAPRPQVRRERSLPPLAQLLQGGHGALRPGAPGASLAIPLEQRGVRTRDARVVGVAPQPTALALADRARGCGRRDRRLARPHVHALPSPPLYRGTDHTHTPLFPPPPPPLVRARSCSPMCACVSRPMHSPPVSGTRHCFPRFQPGFGGASNRTLPPGTPLPPAHADATTLADLLVGLASELVLGDNAGEGDSSPHRQVSHLQVSHLQVSHPPQSFVLSFVGCSHVPLPFMHQPIGGFNRTQSISGLNQSADRSISGCNQPADSLLFFDSTDSSLSSLRRSPCSPTLRRTCAAGRLTHATSWFG